MSRYQQRMARLAELHRREQEVEILNLRDWLVEHDCPETYLKTFDKFCKPQTQTWA